jgi:hypothetical protein
MKRPRWWWVLLGVALALLLPIGVIATPIVAAVLVGFTHPRCSAAYAVPGSSYRIEIAMRRFGFLAEFQRWLYIENAGHRIAVLELFPDTGGYRRANLYRTAPDQWLVRTFFRNSYVIDLRREAIDKVNAAPRIRSDDEFVGAFDIIDDEWRFIPSNERLELPVTP